MLVVLVIIKLIKIQLLTLDSMSFRKEKKFKLRRSELKLFKFSLLEKGMKVLYPKRVITSCYFDTKNLQMFHDSEEGILPRKKIRYRWYNSLQEVNKEIKISSIEGRYKKTYFIGSIKLSQLNQKTLYDQSYGAIYPYILIKYSREYFIYKKLRFTFDTNIEYEKIDSDIRCKSIDKDCVMEIKVSNIINDDYLEKIMFKQTERFSKYCRGIKSFLY